MEHYVRIDSLRRTEVDKALGVGQYAWLVDLGLVTYRF